MSSRPRNIAGFLESKDSGAVLTSGKVPLEKTLRYNQYKDLSSSSSAKRRADGKEYLHQQASLTAGTIAYNDKLSTDFRHLDGRLMEKSK
jgi:hypothetical protein